MKNITHKTQGEKKRIQIEGFEAQKNERKIHIHSHKFKHRSEVREGD